MQHQTLGSHIPSVHDHTVQRNWCLALVPYLCKSYNLVPRSCAALKLRIPVEKEGWLREQYLNNPTVSWDCRKHTKRSFSLNSRHKESKEPVRLDKVHKRSWVDDGSAEAVIQLCVNEQLSRAIDALTALAETQYRVSTYLLYRVIQRCGVEKNLVLGRRIDDLTVRLGYESSSFLANHILRMYASHGRLEEAKKVFNRVRKPDAFMWFSLISAHTKYGKPGEAILLYHEMRSLGLEPNSHIFVAALHACARAEDVESGKQLHADVLESGTQSDPFVCSCLVDMYAKCGELEDARKVFESMATRNVVAWSAMINGYAEHGLGQQALVLYARMEQECVTSANNITYACLLKACASTGALQQGRRLHSQIVEKGLLEGDVVLGNCLVTMYAKCAELEDARIVFDSLSTRNTMTWNAMISGYAEHGLGLQALNLYTRMEQEGVSLADSVTFACLLKACASTGALPQGIKLHTQIVDRGLLERDIVVGTCLVDMYARCGKVEDARRVFDSLCAKNQFTWTAMIHGYVEHGLGQQALNLYARMEKDGLIVPDSVTFGCLLKACASAGALQQGRQLHSQIVERGLLEGDVVMGNCLVNMYAKCGRLQDARVVFDSLSTRNVVTWNAMINGYGKNNEGMKAIACFEEMMLAGFQPNDSTLTCLLVACSHEGLVRKGREYFNAMVTQYGINRTVEHYNCMVDLLGRAGHMDEAENMLTSAGFKEDAVGVMALLNACKSHGDVERGTRCFESLIEHDPQNASAYVLMASTYANADRWADVEKIEHLRKLAGASKKPAVAGIEVDKEVHTFVVGKDRDDIACKVRRTNVRLKEEGNHVPHTKVVLKSLSEKEKEDELCGHAEKLALAYGLLNTPDGTPLLVTKNLRMCNDCHSSTAIMSRVEKREIVVRDAHRVHHFQAGSCSCKGRH